MKPQNQNDPRRNKKQINRRKFPSKLSSFFIRTKDGIDKGVTRFLILPLKKFLSIFLNIKIWLGILLLQIILMFSISLANDIFWMSKNEYEIAENKYPNEAFSNELIVNVQEVNPNTGIVTFDLKFVADEATSSKIEVILDSGSVLLVDNKLSSEYQSVLHRVHVYLEAPEIFERTNLKQAIYEKNGLKIKIGQERHGYLYPFDKYFLQFNFVLLDEESKSIKTLVSFQSNDPRFLHTRPVANITYGQGLAFVPTSLAIFFERPSHQKIFFVVCLLLAFIITLWSFSRVSFATMNLAETIEVLVLNITLLLAVPDLRGLLVPINLQFAPIFDFSVVTIWVLSLLTLAIYVFKNRGRAQKQVFVPPTSG